MSNLPNSQPTVNNSPDDNASDDVISIKPGSIFGIPTAGAESGFIPETVPSPEIQKSPETIPTPAPPQPQPKISKDEVVKPTPIEETAPVQNVVDQTDKLSTLHDIGNTQDKLTREADEEEEHFIEEVEKHHGDL